MSGAAMGAHLFFKRSDAHYYSHMDMMLTLMGKVMAWFFVGAVAGPIFVLTAPVVVPVYCYHYTKNTRTKKD